MIRGMVRGRGIGGVLCVALAGACFDEGDEVELGGTAAATDGEGADGEATDGVDTGGVDTGDTDDDDGPDDDDDDPNPDTDSGDVTGAGESDTGDDLDGSSDDDGAGVQCPACDTGFCNDQGECARGVFVSSVHYSADLNGLTGADAHCENLARIAGHRGDWMAWLSDSNVSAGSRIPGWSSPYVLVDGTQVAASFSVFTTYIDVDAIYLEHPIDRTEFGAIPTRGSACQSATTALPVWTSTLTYEGDWDTDPTCEDWTSSAPLRAGETVSLGNANEVDSFWTAFACSESDCGRTASLYCMQVSAD